ncbi:hypothetical protein [Phyllobacterium sp. 22552]|uniref:hypothetical protein n=1 Tax=Phyllobacterium sp. 22552 TaxID=3453941 RepID=UPI003F86FB24
MYEALDNFFDTENWHSNHAIQDREFARALHEVVHKKDFSPEEMRNYIRQKHGLTGETNSEKDRAVDRLVAKAWAVREYFDANGEKGLRS